MESLNQQIETADNIILYMKITLAILVIFCTILLYKTCKIKLPK